METSPRKPKIVGTPCITSTSEGIDRISSLPDDVIHNILSSISTFDVVKLSLLSKKWKHIWTTMPYLHFDLNPFFEKPEDDDVDLSFVEWDPPLDLKMVENVKDFMNWVLFSQNKAKLVRFRLSCDVDIFDKEVILGWILAATWRKVQELVLSINHCFRRTFELPYCVATCESLRVLKLDLYRSRLMLPNQLGFRHLKLLHLVDVDLSDEQLTNSLFSESPLLENLILRNCSFGSMMLKIASTSLVYVTLHNNDYVYGSGYGNSVVKISCPNLKFLKYKAEPAKDIVIENLSCIESVHFFLDSNGSEEKIGWLVHKMIKGVASTSALELCLDSIWGLHAVAHEVRLSPVLFYELKSLTLNVDIDEVCMKVMILLLKHSPNLEVLNLISCLCRGDNLKLHDNDLDEIVCLESHLKSVQLTNFEGEHNDVELLRFFLKNARVLEKLTIFWAINARKSEEITEAVLKLPRTSSQVALTIHDFKPKRKWGM